MFPAGPLLGLGLWRSRAASLVVALGILGTGIAVYAAKTPARDRVGALGLPVFAAAMTVVGASAFFGAPAPSIAPVAASSVAVIVPLLLIQWIDAHRRVRTAETEST